MKLDGYSLLLPEGTLNYFDVINVVEDSTQIVIFLEEKNLVLDGQYISRNWQLVASGTSMTREFASFLKEICR